MPRVRIVTDSAGDVEPAVAARLGITVVALSIHFGGDVYAEGEDITPEQFYRMLQQNPNFPRTSQPPVGRFEAVYREAMDAGEEVVSIHVSAKFSGTLNAAQVAARNVGAQNVRFVDSFGASVLQGQLAITAAQLAAQGAGADTIVTEVERLRPKVYGLIMLEDLGYLQRGGRIGRAQSLVGTLLSVKPIIEVINGEVAPVQRVRTLGKALQTLAEDAKSRQPLEQLAILHSNAPEAVEMLKKLLLPIAPEGEIPVNLLGAVVGVHVGPGAIGVYTRRK